MYSQNSRLQSFFFVFREKSWSHKNCPPKCLSVLFCYAMWPRICLGLMQKPMSTPKIWKRTLARSTSRTLCGQAGPWNLPRVSRKKGSSEWPSLKRTLTLCLAHQQLAQQTRESFARCAHKIKLRCKSTRGPRQLCLSQCHVLILKWQDPWRFRVSRIMQKWFSLPYFSGSIFKTISQHFSEKCQAMRPSEVFNTKGFTKIHWL